MRWNAPFIGRSTPLRAGPAFATAAVASDAATQRCFDRSAAPPLLRRRACSQPPLSARSGSSFSGSSISSSTRLRPGPRLLPAAAAAATAREAAAPDADAPWEQDWDSMGPAFRATLELLEWPALCEHVASFASTAVGRRQCARLEVPMEQAASERLLEETR